jgi:hypothetical protein
VKKAELLFNRPFFIFHGGRCQKQTLYSTVIVDFSETLARACEMLERALDGLTLMNPSDLAGTQPADLEVDQAIARALGFQGLITHSLPLTAETEAKREVAQALALVADAAMEISEQLTANDTSGTSADMAYGAVAASEWLRAECQRLTLLELPKTESLLAWEVRRRNLAACLASINDALRHVAAASLASFGIGTDVAGGPAERRLPEAAKRRLAFDLIVAGVAPAKAKEASEALCRYLVDQKLSAKQILVGELGRIHPSLLPRSLETLATLEGGAAVMAQSGAEKSQTMSRAKRLSETFKRTLVAAAPTALLLLAIGTSGCGLKTRPTSDVLEPRPDIPFREEPARDAVAPVSATPVSAAPVAVTPVDAAKPVDAPAPGTETQPVPWTPVGQPKTDGGKQP